MSKKVDDRAMFKIDKETETSITIPDDVFESIVLFAALGTEGVYSVGGITKDKIETAGDSGASAIKVEVFEKEVKIYISLTISYGYNIPDVSKVLMERIKTNVENMTEFSVSSVNVRVSGINMNNR